jgi:exodeoxyribonuclease V alpha subunit
MVKTSKHSALVRVLTVRVQNRHGAIFRAQRISDNGEILDTHAEVVAQLDQNAVGVKVVKGQWWELKGDLGVKTFINASGFQMSEEHLEVRAGDAILRLPSGGHIVDYLATRFDGIGPRTAERLWEKFSHDLIDLLDQGDYQSISTVVSAERAQTLIEGWNEEGLSKTLQWLQSNGIGLAIGRKIISYFGAEALEKIEENPYRLLSFAAGWAEVDSLATTIMGIQPLDTRRLAAVVEEVVYRRFSAGDTFVPKVDLVDGIRRLLAGGRQSRDVIDEAITASEVSGRLLFDQNDNAYSLGASILENRVVDGILARRSLRSPSCDVDAVIAAYEAKEGRGFRLNDEQRSAVEMVASHHFSVISGGAGCGKTTVLKAVCEILDAQGFQVVQLALAGKAVKRMQESTGRQAMTLASFLKKVQKDRDQGATRIDAGLLAILIDEASMVDLLSFSGLVREVDDNVKMVLIGDPHQLPPVGPGLILHCLTDGNLPHVELKVAKRFGSEIAEFANSVKEGRWPSVGGSGKVRHLETADSIMSDAATSIYLSSPDESVVLCATRALCASINQSVQEKLSAGRREVNVWNEEYECWEASGLREGDLVICTANHWDLGLQNGSMGRILSMQGKFEEALGYIEWDDGHIREFDVAFLDSLELAYALTVHKSQGSQWRRVIVCLPSSSRLVDRSLIYTAITRAQSEVILLGSAAAIGLTVAREKAADRRRVGLPKRLARMSHNPS